MDVKQAVEQNLEVAQKEAAALTADYIAARKAGDSTQEARVKRLLDTTNTAVKVLSSILTGR